MAAPDELTAVILNAGTINPAQEDLPGADWAPSLRRAALAAKLLRRGADVVGIQEGRSRTTGQVRAEGFVMFRAAANDRGCFGTELWLREDAAFDLSKVAVVAAARA